MAKNDKIMRKMLSENLMTLVEHHKKYCGEEEIIQPNTRTLNSPIRDVCYVFQVLQCNSSYDTYEIYRKQKMMVLNAYLEVTKLKNPDVQHLIGIGIEINAIRGGGSEDLAYLNTSKWSCNDAKNAKISEKFLVDMEFIGEQEARLVSVFEYPQE